MWEQMWLRSWERLWAYEIVLYHSILYVALVIFFLGLARHQGMRVSPIVFIPVIQLYELARKADLPSIVGILLVIAMIATKVIDFFYGFVSMARAAGFLVMIPAYWYIWRRLTIACGVSKAFYAVFFIPVVTEIAGYAILGLRWLLTPPSPQDNR